MQIHSAENISHVHLDMIGGIAGDMFVAAFVDAFPHIESIILEKLAAVLPKSAGEPKLWSSINGGMSVKRFTLSTHEQMAQSEKSPTPHPHRHSHEQTLFINLKKKIEQSVLEEPVKCHAIALLEILAQAEAKMHGTSIEQVHFHELADWDSLMDVIAASVILDEVPFKSFSMSKIPLGGGRVKTQHGLLPVPAPATAEILRGCAFLDDGVEGERVTPTGAAILRYLITTKPLSSASHKTLLVNGYGAGEKHFKEFPNILRVIAFADVEAPIGEQAIEEDVAIIEFDVDDMSGEEMAISLEHLRKTAGVIDITVTSSRGKKGRLIERVCVLLEPGMLEPVAKACFLQTSSLGLRYRIENRKILQRQENAYSPSAASEKMGIKIALRPDKAFSAKLDSDALQALPTLLQRRRVKYQAELEAFGEGSLKSQVIKDSPDE